MPSNFPGVDPYLEAQDLWLDFHATAIVYCRNALADLLSDHYQARIAVRGLFLPIGAIMPPLRIFPWVDPYLESQNLWPDFHQRTITYYSDALVDQLPDQYQVRIEERVQLVEHPTGSVKLIRPDLIVETGPAREPEAGGAVAVAVEVEVEPETIPVTLVEEFRESFIEIIHRPDKELVTVLELLSPDNKSNPGRGLYLSKRNALLLGLTHLVEIDLLVGGQRPPMGRPLPTGDYFAIVARGDRRPDAEVYAWSVRRRLPKIRIPLRAPDPDLTLDLGALYATSFERGRYHRAIDYVAPLSIGLSADDRGWAEGLTRAPTR